MLTIIPTDSEQTVGFTITGRVESDDIDQAAQVIEEKLKTHDKLRIYAEIGHMQGMSFPALLKDLKFALKHFQDFEKEAIVADNKWWQRLAFVGNQLVPGIEVRCFSLSEKDTALQWINA